MLNPFPPRPIANSAADSLSAASSDLSQGDTASETTKDAMVHGTVNSSESPNRPPTSYAMEDSYQLARTIVEAADDRKGADIVVLQVADVSYLADYFIIVTGFSNVQVRAIARSIEEKVEEQWQRQPLRMEGQQEGCWVLMDYGEIVVHIFQPKERDFYSLEAFWGHAEQVLISPVR